jgi:hypothetical protein
LTQIIHKLPEFIKIGVQILQNEVHNFVAEELG